MIQPRTAHARNKKNSKRQIRTVATRSSCKRLADCANRTLWFNLVEIIDLSSCLFLGSHFLNVCRTLKDYFFSFASGTNSTKVARRKIKCKRLDFSLRFSRRATRRATANAMPAVKFQIFRVEQVCGNEEIALWVQPTVRSPSYLSM